MLNQSAGCLNKSGPAHSVTAALFRCEISGCSVGGVRLCVQQGCGAGAPEIVAPGGQAVRLVDHQPRKRAPAHLEQRFSRTQRAQNCLWLLCVVPGSHRASSALMNLHVSLRIEIKTSHCVIR